MTNQNSDVIQRTIHQRDIERRKGHSSPLSEAKYALVIAGDAKAIGEMRAFFQAVDAMRDREARYDW